MSHIVNSCPLTKFDGSLLCLHEADEAAVDWLTTWLLALPRHSLKVVVLTACPEYEYMQVMKIINLIDKNFHNPNCRNVSYR